MTEAWLAELLSTGAARIPWPVRLSDSVFEGTAGINAVCQTKCPERLCWNTSSSQLGTVCPRGLSVYEATVGDCKLKVFGVVNPAFRNKVPTHSDFKTACKGRSVGPEEFNQWVAGLRRLFEWSDKDKKRGLATALEPLHDAMRLARDVAQLANRCIQESDGATFGEKFDNAPITQKTLLKSSELLVETFDLLEVYLNPEAAKFGQPRPVEIYKLLDKLAKIASIARASQVRPPVRLIGATRRSIDVYETFKLIPFCLIDNAQKYSRQGAEVRVNISEQTNGLLIEVQSEGPLIERDDLQRIFERGYRADAAVRAYPSGMGVGLYVCDIVARAHGTRVQVKSDPLGFAVGSVQQGRSVFSVAIRDVVVRRR